MGILARMPTAGQTPAASKASTEALARLTDEVDRTAALLEVRLDGPRNRTAHAQWHRQICPYAMTQAFACKPARAYAAGGAEPNGGRQVVRRKPVSLEHLSTLMAESEAGQGEWDHTLDPGGSTRMGAEQVLARRLHRRRAPDPQCPAVVRTCYGVLAGVPNEAGTKEAGYAAASLE